MQRRFEAYSATSLIDTAQFRRLVQIDAQHGTNTPGPASGGRWNDSDDLARTDTLEKLEVPESTDEADEEPGFDPYNSASRS